MSLGIIPGTKVGIMPGVTVTALRTNDKGCPLPTPRSSDGATSGSAGGVFTLKSPQVASELAQRLGLKLTAALAGVTETRRVNDWIAATRAPRRPEVLIAALQAARAIAARYDNDAARAWFATTNPGLDMQSPTVYLRLGPAQERLDRLVACAVQDIS